MQFAWTGVILEKPMLDMACKIHSDKDGVRASHARVISLRSGAMIDFCFEARAASGIKSLKIFVQDFRKFSGLGCAHAPGQSELGTNAAAHATPMNYYIVFLPAPPRDKAEL